VLKTEGLTGKQNGGVKLQLRQVWAGNLPSKAWQTRESTMRGEFNRKNRGKRLSHLKFALTELISTQVSMKPGKMHTELHLEAFPWFPDYRAGGKRRDFFS
jgi:hypothetical protein